MISQEDIDRLAWFHDFEFPNGLRARSTETQLVVFRRLLQWFNSNQLRAIDFANKSVIDVGCWDGYYSFLAEELGAGSVLAVDDASQNWGTPECFRVARALKQSNVTLMPDVSVYRLSETVQRTFDIVLFFGVYYHLHSPYSGFAQIRAVCHDDSIVVIEGECIRDDEHSYAVHEYRDAREQMFVPTTRLLREMLRSCYLEVERMAFPSDADVSEMLALVPPSEVLRVVARHRRSQRSAPGLPANGGPAPIHERVLIFARPIHGRNPYHHYRPPFGLDRFDERDAFAAELPGGPHRPVKPPDE